VDKIVIYCSSLVIRPVDRHSCLDTGTGIRKTSLVRCF